MREEVVASVNKAHYMPKFVNPIYILKKKQDEIKKEAMKRIKSGSFVELYPLVAHIELKDEEIKDILDYWLISDFELYYMYGSFLKTREINKIKAIDEVLLVALRENAQRR